ncbi:nitrate- and nitrite sensing domain-containing protein [Streptomyces sp. NPDC059918]|uniref:sensor histidine kinase n=1 Tax=unclassified Streptomyces TaxID=2593676 RepID=UPI003651DF45
MSLPLRARRRAADRTAPPPGARIPLLGKLGVPTRMLAVLVIPLLAAVVLAGLRVGDAYQQADRYDRLHQVARLSQAGLTLIDDLQRERDLLIDPQAQAAAGSGGLQNQQERTSATAQSFLAAAREIPASDRLDQHVQAIEAAIGSLPAIRQSAGKPASFINSAYLRVLMPIIGVNNELGGDLDRSHASGWTSYSLALDTAMTWSERALIADAAKNSTFNTDQRAMLLSSQRLQDMAQQEFRLNALSDDTATYDRLVGGADVSAANGALDALAKTDASRIAPNTLPGGWYQAFSTKIDGLNQLQSTVGNRLVDDFGQRRSDAQDQARNDLVFAALILTLALLLAFLVSRSILRGLRDLESAAVEVAETRLPAAMKALTSGRGAGADLQVASVAGSNRDEFAAVGRAVDQLHREAVRLAAGQARLRENVSVIFRNLSHRNQSLVQRQLRLITDLEREEPDPQQLARLFQLDHLATRMRRNSENLLVLAGADTGARTAAPMLLHDTVRSAISEVEQYERVSVHGLPQTAVNGEAVRDVVHLLAELLENAVSFSSPQTEVTVDGQRLPDGRLVVEIRDRGIGMSSEQLAEANGDLELGPTLDVTISERLGLYVVGTLARRHGIEVVLRDAAPGVSTLVILPAVLLHTESRSTGWQGPAVPQTRTPLMRSGSEAGDGPGIDTGLLGHGGTGRHASPDTGKTLEPLSAAPDNDPPTITIHTVQATAASPEGRHGAVHGHGVMGAGSFPVLRPGGPGAGTTPLPRSHAPAEGTGEAGAEGGGLPRRVPRAHLLPGSLDQGGQHATPPDPERIRSRLSDFQSGARRAPHEEGSDG